jgi:putative peptidoglycan lipid II flippase
MTAHIRPSSIIKAAGIIAVFSLLSRLVGLYRNRLFAGLFGAGDLLDSYNASFLLPDFIFNLLVLGTLSVAFIPVFTEYYLKDKEEADKIANTVLTFGLVVITAICFILLLFVPQITHSIIAPGFEGEKYQNTVKLTRIMLLSPIIFTLSSIFASILNSVKRFFIAAIAPILYNVGIIFGAIVLYPRFGIMGLGYGVILGALLHMLAQLIDAVRSGFKLRPNWNLSHPGVQKIKKLFLPRVIGVDNSQVSLLVASAIGSTLASGSLTIFRFANDLQSVPVGIFGAAFAIAAFPTLSENFVAKDQEKYNATFRNTFLNIAFLIIPSAVLVFVMRFAIVGLIRNGAFSGPETVLTAQVLGVFSLSIWAQAINPLFSRVFYSQQNTKTPVITGMISLLTGALLSYIFSLRFGVIGLALGFSIAGILNFTLLAILLRGKLAGMRLMDLLRPLAKILACAVLSGLVTWILVRFVDSNIFGTTFLSSVLYIILVGGAAFIFYFVLGSMFGVAQTDKVLAVVKSRIFR